MTHARWLLVTVALACLWGLLAREEHSWKRATIHGFGLGTSEAQVVGRLGKPERRETG